MSPTAWLAFLAAAGIGAPARYLLDTWISGRAAARWGGVPWGTWLVNTVGCLLAGLIAGLGIYGGLAEEARMVLGSGGLGAFTTFSTFTLETVRLAHDGETVAALASVGLGLVAGALAVLAGIGIASGLAV